MKLQRTIDWKPFSKKHQDYISKGINSTMSVAEGAVRSGKTIDNCIIASIYLETCKDRIHLASGSTSGNAKLNIGDCNGFGLEYLFKGRSRWGKHLNNEALFIDTITGEKIVIFTGGGVANSYKSILGNSYGLWIATEINEHYDSDDAKISFIKVAFDRQLLADRAMTLWDMNPSQPNHPIYTEYIDKYREQGLAGGYNYQHFTINDNLAITEQQRAIVESRYSKGTVWYNRNILGMRVAAEGLIYEQFVNNKDMFVKDNAGNTNFMIISVGIDYGATQGATTFKATGITTLFKEVWTIDEMYIKGLHSPEQIYEKFKEFYNRVVERYGKVTHCFADYGALGQVITYGMNKYLGQQGIPIRLQDCEKGKIVDRIKLDSQLFAMNRRFILKECEYMIDAYTNAIWDDKKIDMRLDDGTSDIDSLDAHEYSIYSFYDKFMIGEIK